MPRATVDYMNARKAAKAASGGTNYRTRECAEYDPDYQPDGFELAMAHISAFSMRAETTRQVLVQRLGIPQQESCDEIPF